MHSGCTAITWSRTKKYTNIQRRMQIEIVVRLRSHSIDPWADTAARRLSIERPPQDPWDLDYVRPNGPGPGPHEHER
eukprot:514137-Pyramimonas_sp.AAC.1